MRNRQCALNLPSVKEVIAVNSLAKTTGLMNGHPNRVDPDKWRPLIMSFQKFYGLGEMLHHSILAEIPEHLYNSPDRDRAIGVTI